MSNPSLGISDISVENLILSALLSGYDSSDNSYALASDLSLFKLEVSNILSGETFAFSDTQFGQATIVPEPSTFVLAVANLLGLLACGLVSKVRPGRSVIIRR